MLNARKKYIRRYIKINITNPGSENRVEVY